MTKTYEQLASENKELRSRLFETEEMLSAIRSGEVDAFVISGEKTEQVYSLSTAESPYRNFVEEMHEGALTLTNEGLILFCNKRFAELVQESPEHIIGSNFNRFITPIDRLNLENLLAKLAKNKNDALIISLINSIYLKLSFRFMPPFLNGPNCIIIATDITDLKKKEIELIELHRQLKQQLVQLQDLRFDIINAKIQTDVANKKLANTIEKLMKENIKLKLIKADLMHKMKGKSISA